MCQSGIAPEGKLRGSSAAVCCVCLRPLSLRASLIAVLSRSAILEKFRQDLTQIFCLTRPHCRRFGAGPFAALCVIMNSIQFAFITGNQSARRLRWLPFEYRQLRPSSGFYLSDSEFEDWFVLRPCWPFFGLVFLVSPIDFIERACR